MADELQDAITGAAPDAMETLKADLGLNKTETTTAVASKEVVKEAAPKTETTKSVDDVEQTKGEVDNDQAKADEPKKLSPLELKISRQTAANRKQAEVIKQLNERLASFEKTSGAVNQSDSGEPKKPDINAFDNYDDYNKALNEYTEAALEYKAEQKYNAKLEAIEAERTQREQQEKLNKIAEAFNSREEKFKATHKNYERNAQALLESFELLPPENEKSLGLVRQYLANSEYGVHLIHHLGANPELVDDITSKQDFFEVARSLFELENSVKGANGAKKIPEPVGDLPRSNSGTKSIVDMDWKEMKQKYNLN